MNTTLMVANLASTINASDLDDMFSIVGNVLSARVVYNQVTGESEGMAYVEMSTREEMQNCILYFSDQPKNNGPAVMVRENRPFVPQPTPIKKSTKRK